MIHFFNPGHEVAVLNESLYYTAPANVVSMQNALSCLPMWYANDGDFVFVEEARSEKLDEKFLPNVRLFSEADIPLLYKELLGQEVCLWGVSPQSIHFFQELSTKYDLKWKVPTFTPQYKDLCSRNTAKLLLEKLCSNIDDIDSNIIPKQFLDIQSIEKYVDETDFKLLAKAPFSSSGRGLLWLPISGITRTERQIMHGILKKQESLTIERVLDKKVDFAMEFMVDANQEVFFVGYSIFQTNEKGAYIGNYLDSQDQFVQKLTSFVSLQLLEDIKCHLIATFKQDFAPYYRGCIGVDMMIYKDNEQYRLHPCLEINMRYNMGYLALKISEKYIDEESKGFFRIEYNGKENNILEQNNQQSKEHPIVMADNKIAKGYLSLCPIDAKTKYHAFVLIEKEEEHIK